MTREGKKAAHAASKCESWLTDRIIPRRHKKLFAVDGQVVLGMLKQISAGSVMPLNLITNNTGSFLVFINVIEYITF